MRPPCSQQQLTDCEKKLNYYCGWPPFWCRGSVCGYIADVDGRVLHVRRGHGCTGHWTAYSL